jgi:hypothetical protein
MSLRAGFLALAAFAGSAFAGAAEAATVHPTFVVAPRLLTPDTPRFQHFGTELPRCRKDKRPKKTTAADPDSEGRAACRRSD